MDDITLQKLEEITDIKQFIEYISVFYPGLTFNTFTIEEIEKALFHTYIKLIGKILYISPKTMRIFITNYLMKYEIMNIKRVILGTILGLNTEEKSSMVNILVEKYLDNEKFMRELIEISSLEELILLKISLILELEGCLSPCLPSVLPRIPLVLFHNALIVNICRLNKNETHIPKTCPLASLKVQSLCLIELWNLRIFLE